MIANTIMDIVTRGLCPSGSEWKPITFTDDPIMPEHFYEHAGQRFVSNISAIWHVRGTWDINFVLSETLEELAQKEEAEFLETTPDTLQEKITLETFGLYLYTTEPQLKDGALVTGILMGHLHWSKCGGKFELTSVHADFDILTMKDSGRIAFACEALGALARIPT